MSLLFILIFIFILFYFFDLGIVIFLIVAFVLVSAVQQSESAHIYIYPLFFGFPFHLGHMLSRSVIAFLPKSKRLLISWLQSPSAVILEPKKTKSVTVFIVSPSIYHEMMEAEAMIFVF